MNLKEFLANAKSVVHARPKAAPDVIVRTDPPKAPEQAKSFQDNSRYVARRWTPPDRDVTVGVDKAVDAAGNPRALTPEERQKEGERHAAISSGLEAERRASVQAGIERAKVAAEKQEAQAARNARLRSRQ